jgi:hypothetical protein
MNSKNGLRPDRFLPCSQPILVPALAVAIQRRHIRSQLSPVSGKFACKQGCPPKSHI